MLDESDIEWFVSAGRNLSGSDLGAAMRTLISLSMMPFLGIRAPSGRFFLKDLLYAGLYPDSSGLALEKEGKENQDA